MEQDTLKTIVKDILDMDDNNKWEVRNKTVWKYWICSSILNLLKILLDVFQCNHSCKIILNYDRRSKMLT